MVIPEVTYISTVVPPGGKEVPKHYGRIVNVWQNVWREHLDHFTSMAPDLANNPGKNITRWCVLRPTSWIRPVWYFTLILSASVSQETSSILDPPPGHLAPRLKLILTRFCPRDFCLETIGDKVGQIVAWFWSQAVKVVTIFPQWETEDEYEPPGF